MNVTLHHGDCLEVMQGMADSSVDAVVTDPPYGLEFMGKDWDSFRIDDTGTMRHRGTNAGEQGTRGGTERWGKDGKTIPSGRTAFGGGKRPRTYRCVSCGKRDQFRNPHSCGELAQWKAELIDPHAAPPTMLAFQEWTRVWAQEVYRVLKPGGHMLAFGGTRTYHRMVCAIEDAGFEIRDSLHWVYGSGFPKSHDVSKAIDKAGGPRKWVKVASDPEGDRYLPAPATPEAAQWEGWGTALKPAHEPICLARKPLQGTVAANVLAWGTGAIWVDGGRVGIGNDRVNGGLSHCENSYMGGWGRNHPRPTGGRWPANVLLSHSPSCNGSCAPDCPVAELDRQSGVLSSGGYPAEGHQRRYNGIYGKPNKTGPAHIGPNAGGASRFFQTFEPEYDAPFLYVAKASRAERNAGCEGLPETDKTRRNLITSKWIIDPRHPEGGYPQTDSPPRQNTHPTVKPIKLMRYLCRLITPPNGTVLDPFCGSGSTGVAAIQEGFGFVGIEREAEYLNIAQKRVQEAQNAARQMEFAS